LLLLGRHRALLIAGGVVGVRKKNKEERDGLFFAAQNTVRG
jgi:hypothetical protein